MPFYQCYFVYVTLLHLKFHESCLQRQILLAPLPPHSHSGGLPCWLHWAPWITQSRPSLQPHWSGKLSYYLCSGCRLPIHLFIFVSRNSLPGRLPHPHLLHTHNHTPPTILALSLPREIIQRPSRLFSSDCLDGGEAPLPPSVSWVFPSSPSLSPPL